MLSRVLLHVIDAAAPIDFALNGSSRNFRRCVMHNFLNGVRIGDHGGSGSGLPHAIHNFQDLYSAETAEIVRLTSGRRIKCRLVENDFPAVSFALAGNDVGMKFLAE